MKKRQSRRKFIIDVSKLIAITIGFLSFNRYFSIAQNNSNTVMHKSINIGNQNKILVAYDGQFGSTAEIAKFIGVNLPDSHQEIDVLKISDVEDLSPYSDIIIGSAIQYDKWMSDAQDFIVKNENELSTKSVSLFLVCLVLSKKTEQAQIKATAYADEIKKKVPKLKINTFGKFAGVLDYSKMSFGQRMLARVIFAIIGVKEGDYRDWDEIKRWIGDIYHN